MKNLLFTLLFVLGFSAYSQTDYESFQGGKSKIMFNKKYTFANIYDYRINAVGGDSIIARNLSMTIPEGALTEMYRSKIALNSSDSLAFELSLHSKYTVETDNRKRAFIKYSIIENDVASEWKLLHVVNDAGQWTQTTSDTEELRALQDVFTFADVEMLFQFFNDREDDDYPEINRLKPETKNANGTLNIAKLREVFNKNRNALSNYLKE